MRKFLAFLLLTLLCVGGWAETIASNPTTTVESGHYYVFQTHNQSGSYTSNYLYDNGTAVKAMGKSDPVDAKFIWQMTDKGDGTYAIRNVYTNRFIDIPNNANGWEIPTRETETVVSFDLGEDNEGVALSNKTGNIARYIDCSNAGNNVVSWQGEASSSKLLKMYEVTDVTDDYVTAVLNVKNNGTTVYTYTQPVHSGSDWTISSVPDYVTLAQTTFNNITAENKVFETTYTSTFPYQFSTGDNPIWYTWKARLNQSNNKGYLYYNANDNCKVFEASDVKDGGSSYFAFVGNEFGFRIINYAAGTGRYLKDNISFDATGTEFVAAQSSKNDPFISNFNIKVKGTANKYLNDVGSNKLGTWDNGGALGDNGSQFEFTRVNDITSYFDSEKVYVLKSASDTYLNFTGDGSTATSYQATPTYIRISQTNTGYVFANALNNEQKLASTHAWNASLTSAGSTWAVAPANDEGVYYVMRRDNGSVGFYLGNKNDTNEGTGVYTDQGIAIPWTIEEVAQKDITYSYKIGEEVVATEVFENAIVGAPLPAPTKSFAFYNITAPEGNVTEGADTYTVNVTWDGPFEFANADLAEGTKWYYLKQDANLSKYVYYEDNEAKTSTFSSTKTTEDNYLWAFVRKEGSTNFYMYNKQAGTMALHEQIHPDYTGHNQGTCVFADAIDGKTVNEMPLTLVQNGTTNYSIKLAAVDGTCILGNHVGGKLSIWGPSANTDNGASCFNFQEFSWSNFVQELITEANTIIEGNNGTTIGKPAKPVVDALAAAVETASAADPKTEETYNTLQTAINDYFATTNVYLPTGYYRMYDFSSTGAKMFYAYNEYAHAGNDSHWTLMSSTAVNTNNGIWYIENNGDGTINIKNGEGSKLNIQKSTEKTTLTFGGYNKTVYNKCPGGVYFSDGLHGTPNNYKLADGTCYATYWNRQDSEGSYWAFEPVNYSKVYNITIEGGNTDTYAEFKSNKIMNGGFCGVGESVRNFIGELTFSNVDGKAAEISSNVVDGNITNLTITYFTFGEDNVDDLKDKMFEVVKNVTQNNIGYPIYDRADADNIVTQVMNKGLATMYTLSTNRETGELDEDLLRLNIDNALTIDNFMEWHDDIMSIWNTEVVNKPAPGGFYNFEDNDGNKEIYYLTENNGLLCYKNGQFAEPNFTEEKGLFVDYAEVGTEQGCLFAFESAHSDKAGRPIIFGKLCAYADGAYLPSGDGNIKSGWTITKTNPTLNTNVNTGYGTFYCPVPAKLLRGKAYTVASEKIDDTNTYKIVLTAIDGDIIPAKTAVIVEKEDGSNVQVTTELTADEVAAIPSLTSDLRGYEYATPNNDANINNKKTGCNAALTLGYDGVKATFKRYNGTNFSGFKAFLPIIYNSAQSSSNTFDFIIADGDDLTGMNNVIIKKVNTPIRDLNGNIIVNPIKGQIYIQNGKAFKY